MIVMRNRKQMAAILLSAMIGELLVLDVKDDAYFSTQGVTNQHGQGGRLFVNDDAVMGWLFGK